MDSFRKEFIKIFHGLCGRHSAYAVWNDFIVLAARSLVLLGNGSHDQMFTTCCKFGDAELDCVCKLIELMGTALEENPAQDFLGSVQSELALLNKSTNQFYTPFSVAQMMSDMLLQSLDQEIQQNGWISVLDPACGAGSLLIAFADFCRRQGINYQDTVLFVAQDVDFIAAMSCLIQLNLIGCAGYVALGNSLSNPVTGGGSVLLPLQTDNSPKIFNLLHYNHSPWLERRLFADPTNK